VGEKKRCPLFRKPESLNVGAGLGYCDLDGNSATCDADVQFCEKLESLRQFILSRLEEMEKKVKPEAVA
jgi:hypothetical protein